MQAKPALLGRQPLEQTKEGTLGEIFALLFVAAVFVSQLSHLEWLHGLWYAPLSPLTLLQNIFLLFGILVIERPSAVWRLISLAVFYFIYSMAMMPNQSNHRLVITLICFAIILGGIVALWRSRAMVSRLCSEEEFFQLIRPALLALLVVVYFFAALAKVNSDFLDPTTSCGVVFLRNIFLRNHTLSSNSLLIFAATWGAMLIEFLFVPGLLWVRTRKFTALVAIAFHLALGFDLWQHFIDFSSVMFCLLVVASGFPDLEQIAKRWQQFYQARLSAWPLLRAFAQPWPWFLVLLCGVFFLGLLHVATGVPGFWTYAVFRQVPWLIFAVVVLYLSSCGAGPLSYQTRSPWPRAASWGIAAVVGALAFVNGASPYLGLKTRTSFNMYSNLQLTESSSNHYFFSQSLDLLGVLRDRVVILETSDKTLAAALGGEFPKRALQAVLLRNPQLSLTYRDEAGQVKRLAPGEGERPDSAELSLWLRKFALFRATGEAVRASCEW